MLKAVGVLTPFLVKKGDKNKKVLKTREMFKMLKM